MHVGRGPERGRFDSGAPTCLKFSTPQGREERTPRGGRSRSEDPIGCSTGPPRGSVVGRRAPSGFSTEDPLSGDLTEESGRCKLEGLSRGWAGGLVLVCVRSLRTQQRVILSMPMLFVLVGWLQTFLLPWLGVGGLGLVGDSFGVMDGPSVLGGCLCAMIGS